MGAYQCPACGAPVQTGYRICPMCGLLLAGPPPSLASGPPTPVRGEVLPAPSAYSSASAPTAAYPTVPYPAQPYGPPPAQAYYAPPPQIVVQNQGPNACVIILAAIGALVLIALLLVCGMPTLFALLVH